MYYQNETDQTLVMLTLAGEQRAYEVLVTRYQKTVIAAAASVTKNHFMAEDAAQDAFVTAWMKLNLLQEPAKFAPWVCRIAKNCAINMITRYRGFMPLDAVDNLAFTDDPEQNPALTYVRTEQKDEIGKGMERLPEKIRQIIYLHYFEDLSIAEIADRMRMPEGTVKWQLHDGRKRLRKELCAMNEKYSDTLVQRVMKKVEELKLWQIKNDKSGFEKVYKEVLAEVEELPECREKQHALADVLMRGWWWLPGKKNDALFERIATAAMEGKNEEVMTFIVTRQDSQVYGGAKIEFIRDKQIPLLEKAGFVKALGREWFWLGYYLYREGRGDEGKAAYDKVEQILQEDDRYRILVPYARKMEDVLAHDYRGQTENRYRIGGTAEEYRFIDGVLCFWGDNGFGEGYLNSINDDAVDIFRNSAGCDNRFFANIALGETYVASDGRTLTFASDCETVETPAGRFEGCQLWVITLWNDNGKHVYKSYYKDGVGIVRHEATRDGVSDAYSLKAYEIKGGQGLLPFAKGNTWEYVYEYDPESIASELVFTVDYANEEKVMLSLWEQKLRVRYNENDWLDMIGQIRCDYYYDNDKGESVLCDITPAIERAEQLAVTPMQKAHTKAAASVARRILTTDPVYNPKCSATGHWNFFSRNVVQRKKDSMHLTHNYRWSFEWKCTGGMGPAEDPILYNDLYGILEDATNCLWSDEWRVGASPVVEYTRYSHEVRTQITCEDGGSITTKAGTFENCLRLRLEIGGMTDGWSYRGGNKVYYFAPGIGIVRTENEYCGGARTAVYELSAYEGTGEGYMPMADGLMRRYDALDLTDGFVGSALYTYVADEDGDIVIFADRTGIREIPSPITQYGAIQGEVVENALWDQGKWQEGHAKYGVNNFHLIMHMLSRPSHNVYDSPRSVALMGFYMRMLEQLGDGEVPEAWLGRYGWMATIRAAACFGAGMNEEGYRMLDVAFEYCEKSRVHKGGDLLDTGNPHVTGGAKYVFARGMIELPDGTREPIADNDYWMAFNEHNLTYAITTPRGWAWFDLVRNEDRFKGYVDRGWAMIKKYNP